MPRYIKQSGFTLVELLVSISIFFIVTTVIIGNYPRFGEEMALELAAHDLALSIRQAQVYGSAVIGTGDFFKAYGISVTTETMNPPANNSFYTLFADKNGNGKLDTVPSDNEKVQSFELSSKRNSIEAICYNFHSVTTGVDPMLNCLNVSSNSQIGRADIVFTRPRLQAKLMACNDAECSIIESQPPSNVAIILKGRRALRDSSGVEVYKRRAVVVWRTGQISVEK